MAMLSPCKSFLRLKVSAKTINDIVRRYITSQQVVGVGNNVNYYKYDNLMDYLRRLGVYVDLRWSRKYSLLGTTRKIELLKKIGFTDRDIRRAVKKNKTLLTLDEKILDNRIELWWDYVGDNKTTYKILARRAELLTYRWEETVVPKLDYLTSVTGKSSNVIRLCFKFPACLTASLASMKEKVNFIDSVVQNSDHVAKVVQQQPQILVQSIETMASKLKWLEVAGFTSDEVRLIVVRSPTILGMKLSSMRDKLDYLRYEMNRSLAEISKCPALTYSLDRYGIRHLYLQQVGIYEVHVPVLITILAKSDEDFAKQVAKSNINQFMQFKDSYLSKKYEATPDHHDYDME